MQELCPNAILFNYANPMAMCCWALGRVPGLQFVGLCHGVQTTMDLIASYAGVPKEEIDFLAAGINHMAWFLRLEHRGRDLYPVLKENFEKPGLLREREGARRSDAALRLFHDREHRPPVRVPALFPQEQEGAGPVLRRARLRRRDRRLLQILRHAGGEVRRRPTRCRSSPPTLGPRSAEYCSHIIEARETGEVFRLNGNVRNDGYITNLPQGCCVEVPIYVDRLGLHPDRGRQPAARNAPR